MEKTSRFDQLELKKFEELYSLTKAELEKEHSRFSSIEEKANRHFSVLVVLLGFVSVGVPDFVRVFQYRISIWHTIFAFAYPLLAISVLLSIFFYMRTISFSRYKNPVIDLQMFDHFKNNRYVDVIYSMAKRNAKDLKVNRAVTDEKIRRATIAFRFTYVSFVLVVVALCSYVMLKFV